MNVRRIVILGLMLVVLSTQLIATGHAATLLQLTLTTTLAAETCEASVFEIAFGWDPTTNDSGLGHDRVGMVAYDGRGVPLAADWNGSAAAHLETTTFGGGTGINTITARPVTVEVMDITQAPPPGYNSQTIFDHIVAQSAPVLNTIVVDPALHVPACAVLPLIDSSASVSAKGLIMITVDQTQPGYTEPGGPVAQVGGQDVVLPADADGNGFDTYTVTAIAQVGGRLWVGVFMGASQPLWVPLDGVTALTPLP